MILLRPLSCGYASVMRIRAWCYANNVLAVGAVPVPVISLGNVSVGGTGKTPCVEYLLNTLKEFGEKPALVSRGYGRHTRGPRVVSSGQGPLLSAEDAGDEPLQIAENFPSIPVLVDEQKLRGVRTAARDHQATVVVLDDGFQHLACGRALDIVVIDAIRPPDLDRVLPEGRLREPVSALKRADAVILSRCDLVDDWRSLQRRLENRFSIPVYPTSFVFDRWHGLDGSRKSDEISSTGKGLAISGIGHPAAFERMLSSAHPGWTWTSLRFRDHHSYTRKDIEHMRELARSQDLGLLVTTAKDAVKLRGWSSLIKDLDIRYYGLKLTFIEAESDFLDQVRRALGSRP